MACTEATLRSAIPRFIERDEFDRAGAVAHIPEIRMAAFKFRLRPGEPDAMMVNMGGRIIARDYAPCRRVDGMKITAAPENRLDVWARQLTWPALIFKHRAARC